MKSSISYTLVTGMLAMSLAACKTSTTTTTNFLQTVDLAVTQSNNESFISLSADFNLGNVSLAELQIPVTDPKTNQNIGTIGFSQLPSGASQISLNVNASLIANADGTLGSTMPNGNPVPLVLGAPTGGLLGINVDTNSRIYLGGDLKTKVYAGVAVAIPGLAAVMSKISAPANIFFSGTFNTNILGVAGVYGSNVAAENGIAVFGEYTTNLAAQMNQVDASRDNQFDELTTGTKAKLINFFFGAPRKLDIK